jgi:hypothetical protein
LIFCQSFKGKALDFRKKISAKYKFWDYSNIIKNEENTKIVYNLNEQYYQKTNEIKTRLINAE